MYEPKTIATDGIHVRINHSDGGGCRNHRLHGVASIEEDIATGLGRQVMGRDDHSAKSVQSVYHGMENVGC
jgi:hypothetical protein